MKILALVGLLSVAGCQHQTIAAMDIYFPKMPAPEPGLEDIMLTAGGSGRLVIDHGCVRFKSDNDGVISTLYWHRQFELVNHGATVAIRDTATGNSYPIGSHVRIGGGEFSREAALRIDPVAVTKCGGDRFGSAWISSRATL